MTFGKLIIILGAVIVIVGIIYEFTSFFSIFKNNQYIKHFIFCTFIRFTRYLIYLIYQRKFKYIIFLMMKVNDSDINDP